MIKPSDKPTTPASPRTPKAAVPEFESVRSTTSTIRLGLWIILLGFGGLVFWA